MHSSNVKFIIIFIRSKKIKIMTQTKTVETVIIRQKHFRVLRFIQSQLIAMKNITIV